jgi:hypothetical protein
MPPLLAETGTTLFTWERLYFASTSGMALVSVKISDQGTTLFTREQLYLSSTQIVVHQE